MERASFASIKRAVKNHVLHTRRADQRREAREISHGKAIAQRAGNRKSEFRILRPDTQIAASRYRRATTRTRARNRRDGRNAATFERVENPVHEAFIAERVIRTFEVAEKRYVCASRERPVPRPGHDQHFQRIVRIDRLAALRELLIHFEGEGVAGLGPVNGDARDAAAHIEKEILGRIAGGHRFSRQVNRAGPQGYRIDY